jgi:hypothetical protein
MKIVATLALFVLAAGAQSRRAGFHRKGASARRG